MKAILILHICIVLFCAVCSASDSYLDYRLKLYSRYVGELQNDIQEKINMLYRQSILSEFSTQFSWTIAQHTLFGDLDSKISEALKETLEQVDSATEQTKNVQHCYDTQHQTFEVLKYRALLVYYECENAGLAELRTRITDMDEIAEQGKKTIEKLKNVIPSCWLIYSLLSQEACIVANIKDMKPSVQVFWGNYKGAHQIRVNRFNQILKNFDNCYDLQIRPLHEKVEEIKAAASKCAQGVQ
uniref:Venom protein n=1 Tax=Ampulex compressa TaxID=860918 RepID=A0A1W6EW01_AMPCP|nr:venom protein [Ampulex compressa]